MHLKISAHGSKEKVKSYAAAQVQAIKDAQAKPVPAGQKNQVQVDADQMDRVLALLGPEIDAVATPGAKVECEAIVVSGIRHIQITINESKILI